MRSKSSGAFIVLLFGLGKDKYLFLGVRLVTGDCCALLEQAPVLYALGLFGGGHYFENIIKLSIDDGSAAAGLL